MVQEFVTSINPWKILDILILLLPVFCAVKEAGGWAGVDRRKITEMYFKASSVILV